MTHNLLYTKYKLWHLLMPLVLVLDLEKRTTILDGKLRDYCNHPEDLAVPPDFVAVNFLENPPCFELPIDCLVS